MLHGALSTTMVCLLGACALRALLSLTHHQRPAACSTPIQLPFPHIARSPSTIHRLVDYYRVPQLARSWDDGMVNFLVARLSGSLGLGGMLRASLTGECRYGGACCVGACGVVTFSATRLLGSSWG